MLHRSAVVLVLVVLVLLGIVSSVIGGDLGREESLRILVVETAPQDKDSAEIVRLAGESAALETDLLRMDYEPFQVNTVRIQGNWAFLNLLSFPSEPAPHPDGVFPDILLALAQKDAGGTWHIYLETSEVYHQRLFELPDSLLSPESKNLLASAPVRGQSESRSSDLVPGLPWVVNGSWRYNQSPHGEDESALDFGTPTLGVAAEVRAADTGMVLYAYETCVSVKRRDGLRVGYQHIRPSDVARFTPGEMVHLGDSVGMTTVADGCGGTSTGHHVHFWLETDAGPLNLQGVAMNDWVVTGQQLIRGTEIANPNHADLLLHAPSIADEFDFPVGPPNGTGYGHYSNNGYDVQNTRLPDENSECFGVNWRELWHAGEDWFELGNTAGMAGDPVFAIADGKVQYISPPTYDYRPGAVIILAHRLPDNSITYSMYGHLDPNEIKVYELQEVVRGQQIGRVYDQGWNSHLHWEVRSFEDGSNLCPILPGSGVPGPGYSYPDHPGTIGYYNPSAYVLNQGTSSNDHVSVALIIDATGSMSSNDPNGLRKEAAKAFVDATQIGDKVAIVAFNTTAYHFQPLLTIQSQADRDTLKAAIEQIGDWGNTDLNVGLNGGFSELLSDTSANRKAAIFLTDGLPTYPYDPQSHLQYQAQGWPVYTIGLSEDADEQLLGLIAAETGGTYTQLANPNDLQAIYFELSAQIAGGNILLEDEFILTAGSVQEVSTSLTPYQAQATFFVSWDGGDVSASLVSPGGRQIDDTTNSPDVYYARGLTYEIYTVQFPETGEWTMNVTGQSLPIGGSEVNIRVASEGPRYVYLPTVLNQFDGAPQPPPYQPYNPNPYDNATNQPVNVLLSWAGGDPANEPVTYDVYFGLSETGLYPVHLNASSTTYYPGLLSEGTTYYWKVVSRDIHGAIAVGPLWRFSTSNTVPTGTPEATMSSTPLPTFTPTPIDTFTPTPTATQTHTPAPTQTPTPTPTSTPTFTPTPTATPTNTPLPPPPGPTILLGPSTNNGGFESGTMSGWTMLNGFVDVNGDFVHSGSYSVHGTSAGDESGGQPPVIFYRDISLEPYRLWIDAGLGVADYEAWLHNGNSEYYRFFVRFFNSSGTNLGTYDTGWIRDTGGGYHQHGEQRNIPVGTSYVRVEAQMKRYAGSYTDVDIDDMTFRIQFNNP